MANPGRSLNRKFDLMIGRLDVLADLVGSINKTLERYEERLNSIEGTLKDIHTELLEKVVDYGDRVLLQTENGTRRAKPTLVLRQGRVSPFSIAREK